MVVVNVVLLELLLHAPWEKILGGGSSGGSSGGAPSMVGISIGISIVYAIVVAFIAWPMAVAATALTEGEDEVPLSFIEEVPGAAVRHWLRLCVLWSPLLVLAILLVRAMVNAFADAFSAAAAGGEPSTPLVLKVAELLGKHPMDWLLAVAMVGAWCLYAAADAVDVQRGVLPGSPAPLVKPRLAGVLVLAVASTVVFGPVMRTVLKGLGEQLFGPASSATGSSAEGMGIVAVVGVTLVVAVFTSLVALAWIALFDEHGEWGEPVHIGDGGDDTLGVEPHQVATADFGAAAATAAATPQPQLHDLQGVIQPGGMQGWWVHAAQAGDVIQAWSAVGQGAPPRIMACDPNGQWIQPAASAPDGSVTLQVPAAGWWHVAAICQDASPQNVGVRLQLPPGAQLQQQAAA